MTISTINDMLHQLDYIAEGLRKETMRHDKKITYFYLKLANLKREIQGELGNLKLANEIVASGPE